MYEYQQMVSMLDQVVDLMVESSRLVEDERHLILNIDRLLMTPGYHL